MMQEIQVTLAKTRKEKPQDESKLGFGRIFTDHMFLMNYETGKGWINPRVVPYGDFALDPAAMVLHYGQAIFEGTPCGWRLAAVPPHGEFRSYVPQRGASVYA